MELEWKSYFRMLEREPWRARAPTFLRSRVRMRPINVNEFVEFGITIQTIRWYAATAFSGQDDERPRHYAKIKAGELEYFRDRWLTERNVGLELIDAAISELTTTADLEELTEWRAKIDPPPSIPKRETDWERVFRSATRSLNDLLTVLEHDFPKWPIIAVSSIRAFDTTILMNQAEKALSDVSQKRLSDHWREGWREAGRCLVFDAPTAAAFQVLRVTEGVIKNFRRHVTHKPIPDSDGLSEHITALKTGGVGESVVSALRSLKNAHRNPTMHPGKNLTLDEAAGLFGLCTSVIDFISADAERRDQEKAILSSASPSPEHAGDQQ